MNSILIEDFKPVHKGNLLALFTVVIKGTKIHDCRLIQQPGQKYFVSGPQREWIASNGAKKFFPVVAFSPELKATIEQSIASLAEPLTAERV